MKGGISAPYQFKKEQKLPKMVYIIANFFYILVSKYFQRKIVNIFLPTNFNIHVLGAQKNRLIETVLLSTHNICFAYVLGDQKNRLIETALLSTHNICLVEK